MFWSAVTPEIPPPLVGYYILITFLGLFLIKLPQEPNCWNTDPLMMTFPPY